MHCRVGARKSPLQDVQWSRNPLLPKALRDNPPSATHLGLTFTCDITNITNMTDANTIPATLRAIRANLNLTQEQLAERLGVSFATINRWEGGTIKPQKAARATILTLAGEAGVDLGQASSAPEDAAAQVTRRRRTAARSAIPSTK